MRGIRNKLFAVVVMAVWLFATQHCGLEAAGLFAAHDEQAEDTGCCAAKGGCDNDGCATVEDGEYRPDTGAPAVAAPQLSDCVYLVCWSLAVPQPETLAGISLREHVGRPLDWVRTWQFVQRSALSPRAPSLG